MIPARNRERKCSTCRHYQASPLWRKGWCRNPLLYDRNTNHLVEADSLACNRTFIDYWEPLDTSRLANANGGAGEQTSKPRIAPSVPLEQVDHKGNRRPVSENTPATGNSIARGRAVQPADPVDVPPRQVLTLDATRKRSPLSIFTEQDDLLDEEAPWTDDPKATQQIEEIEGPDAVQQPATGKQATVGAKRKARGQRRPTIWTMPLPYVRAPLWVAMLLLAAIAIGVGGFFVLRSRSALDTPLATSMPSVTVALATATGFGDPTATTPPQPTTAATAGPTQAPVPPGAIGEGVWIQVTSSNGLVVRSAPSLQGSRITGLGRGTKALVIGGPTQADGYTWWQISRFNAQNPDQTGWSVETFMQPTTAP
ncbi:MAG TPA: SH3 domain-containing protein [Chloroflexia bacterium]